MKHTALFAAGALALSLSSASGAVGFIADPSFEGAGPTFDGSVGGELTTYEGFAGSPNTFVGFTTNNPNSGAQSLELVIAGDDNSFAGVYQDVAGLIAGDSYTFAGFHAATQPQGVGIEFRIEWRDSVGDVEIGRTGNGTGAPTAAYEPFSLTETAPAGADTARVVYAIQTFGGEPDGGASNAGTVYVDDISLSGNFVPEPTTTLMGALGLLGLLARRRR